MFFGSIAIYNLLNPPTWMTVSSSEELRYHQNQLIEKILKENQIIEQRIKNTIRQ